MSSSPYEWEQHGYAKSPFRLPTQRACSVVFRAASEAARLGAAAVEPEHLLLSLTDEPDTLAERVLERLSVSRIAVRDALLPYLTPRGPGGSGGLLLTSAAKQVIDLAYEEASRLDNLFLGVEHLLIAFLRLPDTAAYHALTALGLTAEQVRHETHTMKWG
jgi:ATP-dependent Clp protease ATP-binding subunit ClpA